jgi:hypothetical protein
MHTAICTFEDHDAAQRAVDRMHEAGFDRRDVHLEHRHRDGTPMDQANDAWDGLEREVAVDRSVLERLGTFFGDLFGKDAPSRHRDSYAQAVDRGLYVVIVDAHDDAEARRAQALMHDMNAADMDVVHRPAQRPLRDILGPSAGVPVGTVEVGGLAQPVVREDREEERAVANAQAAARDKPSR